MRLMAHGFGLKAHDKTAQGNALGKLPAKYTKP